MNQSMCFLSKQKSAGSNWFILVNHQKKVLSIVYLASRNENRNYHRSVWRAATSLNKAFSIYKNLVLSKELIKFELYHHESFALTKG